MAGQQLPPLQLDTPEIILIAVVSVAILLFTGRGLLADFRRYTGRGKS